MHDIMKEMKQQWEVWDIRAFMMISLSLQTFLILFTPLRKRTSTNWTIMPLWCAYLLADWAAVYAVGQISNTQNNGKGDEENNVSADLLALWAPILLVHLGGPDTITAFALEDNELWLRHLLGLITQTSAAAYVFFQSLPKNRLWASIVLMFVSGTIKCLERVLSLHAASQNTFRDSLLKDPDPGPTYASLVDDYYWKTKAHLPTHVVRIREPTPANKGVNRVKTGRLTRPETILYAHRFFETFKGLLVDLIFSQRERDASRSFFLVRKPRDAFRVIETELNLMYDVLFTKVGIVYRRAGYVFRFVSFACFAATLGIFYCDDKSGFRKRDVAITYVLLVGGIFLDVLSFLIMVTSDWLLVATKKLPDVNIEEDPPNENEEDPEEEYHELGFFRKVARVASRRWCESVSAYNLISYCRNRRSLVKEEFTRRFGLTKFLNRLQYVEQVRFTMALRNHIFHEIRRKSKLADDLDTAKGISAARGDWVLGLMGRSKLLDYVLTVDYDHSILLWHIATELCYEEKEEDTKKNENYREFSKILSDYMMYLLIMQPAMMSAVGGIGQIRFRDTCAEAEKFLFKRKNEKVSLLQVVLYGVVTFLKYFVLVLVFPVGLPLFYLVYYPIVGFAGGRTGGYFSRWRGKGEEISQNKACERIREVNTEEIKPVTIKGDRSKSVLFDGCILAKELKKVGADKWETVSRVWVEILSYAAVNCRAHSHAQELSKGGELITFVWLLMIHLGLGNQYQIRQDQGRVKLMVDR
ncbi:hypothetical protein STAS_02883 [Striga asiatica]|uniref:DUF4220 domain-containing protein n=1 Tax=Striga asiatica TaxID=4170 RepID=A0A5A7P379_STRAF|nr:hypothetical protein STAS_02883 [Striga asiatica]